MMIVRGEVVGGPIILLTSIHRFAVDNKGNFLETTVYTSLNLTRNNFYNCLIFIYIKQRLIYCKPNRNMLTAL